MTIEPLMSEVEAARAIGIKPRQLRDARYNGEVEHCIVAGHAMYRAGMLEDFIRERTCPVKPKARGSSKGGKTATGSSGGPKTDGQKSVQRALEIADGLTANSTTGSASVPATNRESAQVIPING